MPTYDYVCTLDDEHRFEVSQRIEEPPLETCEVCGGTLRKVFHPVGVVLKGSGFYRTDSRTPPKKSDAAAKEPVKDAPESKPDASGGGTGAAKGAEGKGSS